MEKEYLFCKHCGKLIEKKDREICCGEEMTKLCANTVDAAVEKHKPIIKSGGVKTIVEVGEVLHPMSEEHSIEYVYLKTTEGIEKKDLRPGDTPKAVFESSGEIVGALAYCNLHGLWMTEL